MTETAGHRKGHYLSLLHLFRLEKVPISRREHDFCLLRQARTVKTEAGVQQEVADGRRLPVAVRSSMHACEMRRG